MFPLTFLFTALKVLFAPAKIVAFIKGIFEFIFKYWKQIAIVGMIGTIFYQNFMAFEALRLVGIRTIPGIIHEYKEELDVIEQQLQECEASRATLKHAINERNAEIERWVITSKNLQKDHDQLVKQIATMRQKSRDSINKVLKEPTPANCESSIQYLRDATRELKWSDSQ